MTLVVDKRYISWRDTKRISALQADMEQGDIEAASLEIQNIIVKCITSIPEDWLVPDAPKKLDWSKGESLDWLQSGRMFDLINLVTGGEEKN